MPTEQQLIAAFKAAADSGDAVAAKAFADELQKLQAPVQIDPRTPDYKQIFANPVTGGGPQSTGSRFARGAQDLVDRATQLSIGAGEKLGLLEPGIGDLATQQINVEQDLYEKERARSAPDGKPGIDFARIGGNAAALAPTALLAPAGGTGYGAAAVNGAVQGAAAGALQYDRTNSVAGTAKNAAVGGLFGGALGPVVKGVADTAGKVGGYVLGRFKGIGQQISGATNPASIIQQVPEIASLPQQAQRDLIEEAAEQIKATGKLDAEAIARKANLLANGVTPTKSMVTRSPQDWAVERNLSKLTGPDERLTGISTELTDVYRGNDAALGGKLRSFGENLPKGSQEKLGSNVLQSVDDIASKSQEEVSRLYNQVRDARGAEAASDAINLKATLDDLADSTYAEKLVGSVKNKLRRFGMLDDAGNLNSNVLTVNQAEELRKFVNRLPNDFGKKDIIAAIDRDVISGLGDDAFKPAREAAASRFELLGNPGTQKALGAFGELSEGKTAQNFIQQQIINGSEKDVTALMKTVGQDPNAVKSLRAGVLQYLEGKAINPNSGEFSGANLNKALQQIGPEKLSTVFGPDQAGKLQSLARAGLDATYQPPYSAVNSSNTAPALLSLTRRARAIPGVPLVITDEAQNIAARAGYQSQLADALAARSGATPDSDTARALALALARSSAGAGPSATARRNQ